MELLLKFDQFRKDYVNMLITRALCVVILIASSCAGFAQQTIAISWPSKQLISQPLTVNGNTSVNVVLQNVNDVLYTYEVTLVATPVPPPSILTQYAPAAPPPAGQVDPCDAPKTQLAAIVVAFTA